MYVEEYGAAPVKAAAVCNRGDLLVDEDATGLALPGTTVSGHSFLGFCSDGFDNTDGLDGVLTHNKQARTVRYALGVVPVEPASGVTPFPGMRCYLASATTFSGVPLGPFIGLAVKPSHESGIWLVDMRPSVAERKSKGTFDLVAVIDDISTASSGWIVAPRVGRIVSIRSIIYGAISGADAGLTSEINGTLVTGSAITVANAGSAAGDVDSASPTAANVFAAGDKIEAITDGASTGTVKCVVVYTCQG